MPRMIPVPRQCSQGMGIFSLGCLAMGACIAEQLGCKPNDPVPGYLSVSGVESRIIAVARRNRMPRDIDQPGPTGLQKLCIS
jgi:hypothetical protein